MKFLPLACLTGIMLVVASGCAVKAAPVERVTVCGTALTVPNQMPPAGSDPIVLMALPCMEQGSKLNVIPAEYRQYVQLPVSRPAEGIWVLYDEKTQAAIQDDFRRLWSTGRLDDLTIAVTDYRFPNGTVGKFITYTLREPGQ